MREILMMVPFFSPLDRSWRSWASRRLDCRAAASPVKRYSSEFFLEPPRFNPGDPFLPRTVFGPPCCTSVLACLPEAHPRFSIVCARRHSKLSYRFFQYSLSSFRSSTCQLRANRSVLVEGKHHCRHSVVLVVVLVEGKRPHHFLDRIDQSLQ